MSERPEVVKEGKDLSVRASSCSSGFTFSMMRRWSAGSLLTHIRTMPWRVLQAAQFPDVGVRVLLDHDPSAHLPSPWVEHWHPLSAGVLLSSGQLSWVDYQQNKKSSALVGILVAHGNTHLSIPDTGDGGGPVLCTLLAVSFQSSFAQRGLNHMS